MTAKVFDFDAERCARRLPFDVERFAETFESFVDADAMALAQARRIEADAKLPGPMGELGRALLHHAEHVLDHAKEPRT